jgi:CRISPR-associated protein Cas1
LPATWRFTGRRRHPPPDPINAMLSFGYTMLHNHLVTALTAAGLDPRIGFFHREHGSHAALASDIQEEFRHMVDAQVWSMVRRHEAKLRDFQPSPDGRYPCLMTSDLRRRFILNLERRMTSEFKPGKDAKPITYSAFMHGQAMAMKEVILGDRAAYEPLCLHA